MINLNFKDFMEVQGYRGIGSSEMKNIAQGKNYNSSMKSGDVYFDTGDDAKTTAMNYINQGGGGDPKINNAGKKGYLLNMNVPDEDANQPDFKTDTGVDQVHPSYKAVKQMNSKYVPSFQTVRPDPRGPMKIGDMSIARQPIVGKSRNTEKFMQTYNRMFNRNS